MICFIARNLNSFVLIMILYFSLGPKLPRRPISSKVFFCIRLLYYMTALASWKKMANGREGKGENQLFSADL